MALRKNKIRIYFIKLKFLLHYVRDEHALKIFQVNDYEHVHYSKKENNLNK